MIELKGEDPRRYEAALADLERYLRPSGQFITHERRCILLAVLREERPFYASDLHHRLVAEGRSISLTTVYNTLSLLCRAGLAIRLGLEGGTAYLCRDRCANRLFVVCNECGKLVYHHRYKLYEQFARAVVPHFSRLHPVMLGFGYCRECRKKLFRKETAPNVNFGEGKKSK